jgi:glucose/arabinose dehydrogenase
MRTRKAGVVGLFGVIAGIFLVALVVYTYAPSPSNSPSEVNGTETVVQDLQVPWGIEFLPGGDMLVTERPGTLRRIGDTNTTYELPEVAESGESGLLGVELHPGFHDNRYIYLYHTRETEDGLKNRVARYRLQGGELQHDADIITGLPGAPYHDGGRIEFGPEGYLYVTVGEATSEQLAQDPDTFHGTILRLNSDGSVPEDNPFGSEVYSYGHRNPQGLTWVDGQLWATEHGDRAKDELNRIEAGQNYGWPEIEGSESAENMVSPVIQSGSDTWAPAGAESIGNTVYFTGLRGSSLYEAEIQDGNVDSIDRHLHDDFGRLRAIEQGPDGDLYISTSNRDGRGIPDSSDDRIIRLDPELLEEG